MRSGIRCVILVIAGFIFSGSSFADENKFVRLTQFAQPAADFTALLIGLNSEAGTTLAVGDFVKSESRDLAYTSYERFDQVKDGVRIKSASVRIWRDLRSKLLIQLEANLAVSSETEASELFPVSVYDLEQKSYFQSTALAQIKLSNDSAVRGVELEFLWDKGIAVVQVVVKARRGAHTYIYDARTKMLVSTTYRTYPHSDLDVRAPTEFSVPARVYPVYEEYKKERLPRTSVRLKYLSKSIQKPDSNPYAVLQTRRYLWNQFDAVLGSTAAGQALGHWNFVWIRSQVEAARAVIPVRPNLFASGPVYLHGRYATISLHPEVYEKFSGIGFGKQFSNTAAFTWKEDAASGDWEMIPSATLLGRSLDTRYSALQRPVIRHPEHDPLTYINAGFDEVQVYFAINELFETLRPLGMTDPDLGSRPFHAVLFDPDIESQDNAYYTDDTINFSTYTKDAMNYARDNTTIWHELGHGVMDRLMGERLNLADTGGLSEGMADFVAELVLRGSWGSKEFPGSVDQRINNDIGFFLTNEVHDDGEAYGGVMKNILDLAIKKYGPKQGLAKITDLILEAMRLSRDHPGLTAEDWFNRILFADSLGRTKLRAKGELTELVNQALHSRNFSPEADRAVFSLVHEGNEVASGSPGSRDNEIPLVLTPTDTASKTVHITVKNGKDYAFAYPVTVKVFYNSGPLQGAIDWQGEDIEPSQFEIAADCQSVDIPLTVNGTCDAANRSDGSCSDFAYVQIWNKDGTRAVAKKRFYLRIKNQE